MKKKRFDEDIWLISKLYSGSYCDLNLAFWPEENEQVVIKTVRPDVTDEEKVRIEERLLKEASTLEEFWNDAFPKVYDIRKKEDTGTLYLILEHFDGNSLRDYLNIHNEKGLPASFIDQFIKQMSTALHYLHHKKKICHLDLSPENIMVDLDQNFHIIDFEESQLIGDKIKVHRVRGKQDYLAPEMMSVNDHSVYSAAADIYSLGIIIREIFERTKGLKKSQKRYYQAVIRNCLTKRPEVRPTALSFPSAPVISPFLEKLLNLRDHLIERKTIYASIFILISLTSLYLNYSQPKKQLKRVQRQVRKPRKIVTTKKPRVKSKPKAKIKAKSKPKKVVKAKTYTAKPIKIIKKKKPKKTIKKRVALNYQTLLKQSLRRSKRATDSCLKQYATPNALYRYAITVSPKAGLVTQTKPLATPPRRLTYCLSNIMEDMKFPKSSRYKDTTLIQSFSLKRK